MIEASGITLREAMEAILVIFIMAAYLERTGERWKKKFVYIGAAAAVVLSVILGIVLTMVGVEVENEVVEGTMFFLAAILVASLVAWMWRKGRHLKQEIEQKVAKAGSGLTLAGIAFFMVLREGVETVVFLRSLMLSGSSPVQSFIGGLVGLGLALLFGFVFLRNIAKINLSRFFTVTSAILAVLVLKLIAGGFHEFMEVGILPSNQTVLGFVGFFTKDSTGAVIIALMMLSLIGTIIYDLARVKERDLSGLKPVERRKARYELTLQRYFKVGSGVVIMIVVLVMLAPTVMAAGITVPEPVPVTAQSGLIRVAIPSEDGLSRFRYEGAGFIVATKEGKPYVGLDWCYICPPKGYGFDGEVIVCLNCSAPIEIETIGNPGGCNPRVVDFRTEGSNVVIQAQDLLKEWNGVTKP
ncbi:MAG: DUF2318 domain-containing protein [Chloroflexi bacterium]|nr:DUF2318 domain-containing protein [Chloroflexota bacterium]